MVFLNGFDAGTVDPSVSFDPIPNGKYIAMIVASELKPTKDNRGKYLELIFEVASGQYKGKKVWARLNLENPSADAIKMARAELSAICRAVGVMRPNDSVDLHNLPLCIKVVCKKREDNGEMANEIKGYEKKEAAFATPATIGATSMPTAPAAQATNDAPPWQR